MISGAAFCPQAPVLVPDVAGGAAAELDDLRAACSTAIRRIATPGAQLVVLGAADSSAFHPPLSRGTLAGFGVPLEVHLGAPGCGGATDLPDALTVAAWLANDAIGPRSRAVGFSVGPDFAASRAAIELLALAETRELALIVAGDGSARRSIKAPGYLDDRAAPFDETVGRALGAGDPAVLEHLDRELGAALLAAGTPAWALAGELLGGPEWDAELLYDDAPYGVGYFVAAWTARA